MDMVTIICYGEESKMSRQEAIEEFTEGVMYCEGSEQARYINILMDLKAGKTICTDQP